MGGTCAHLRGASLGAELSRGYHGPIIVLEMARDRQNGESSINSVISNGRASEEPATRARLGCRCVPGGWVSPSKAWESDAGHRYQGAGSARILRKSQRRTLEGTRSTRAYSVPCTAPLAPFSRPLQNGGGKRNVSLKKLVGCNGRSERSS